MKRACQFCPVCQILFFTFVLLIVGCGKKQPSSGRDFSKTNVVTIALGVLDEEAQGGLQHLAFEKDGTTTITTIAEMPCRCLNRESNDVGYLYFTVHPTFKKRDVSKVLIEIEYYDAAPGTIRLEYDRSKPGKRPSGAYTRSRQIAEFNGSERWRTAVFEVQDATFRNGQNSMSDFRLRVTPPKLCVRRVSLTRAS